jgi:hypothetical protein
MNPSKPKTRGRSIPIYLLGAAASLGVLAYGLYTGKAMVPARYIALDVGQQNHQLLFWLTEAFWLLMALASAFVALKQIQRQRHAPDSAPVPAKPAQAAPSAASNATPANFNGPELRSTSPTGRYIINIYPVEMRMSLWVEQPELLDTATGQRLFLPKDSNWSFQSAAWKSDTVVTIQLRKYPDGLVSIEATLDCAGFTAAIGGIEVEDFREATKVEQALKQAYEAARSKAGA